MKYDVWKNSIQSIIDTIENGFVGLLGFFNRKIFPVKIVNPVKKVEVKGQVIVSNQKRVENKLLILANKLKKLDETVKAIEIPNSVEVSNFKLVDIEPLITQLNEVITSIKNIPEPEKIVPTLKTLHTQLRYIHDDKRIKSVKVVNQSELIRNLEKIVKQISKIKLDPVVVPAPKVEVNQDLSTVSKSIKELKSELNKIKLKFDYNRFEKIIKDNLSITVSGGRSSFYAFRNSSNEGTYGLVDDKRRLITVDHSFKNGEAFYLDSDDTYVGYEKPNGEWFLQKLVGNQSRYASQVNNPSVTTYNDAWTNRTSLTYGLYSDTL